MPDHFLRLFAAERRGRAIGHTACPWACLLGLALGLAAIDLCAQEPGQYDARSNQPAAVVPTQLTIGSEMSAPRLAQILAGPETVRPGIGSPLLVPPPPSQPSTAPPASEAARPVQEIASPFDPSQFRLPTLGYPPGLGLPEPSQETKDEYGRFVAREISPENTIQVVVGRAKVISLRDKPRRIYIPDEKIAAVQMITDQEFSVVGKKTGTTVLDLWFADPANPNDPARDRTLSYMVVVLPDIEMANLEVIAQRRRLEGEARAYERALKALEVEIKTAFPDSAVRLSLVGDQVVVRGEAKDAVEALQILTIVARHTPTARRTQVKSPNVNVAFIPGLSEEQAAVEAIRQLLEGSPSLVNLMRIPGEQQVMLMVTVAEVNRTAARSIGIDFNITKGAFAFVQNTGGADSGGRGGGVGGRDRRGGRQPALSQVTSNLGASIDNGSVLMAIQALRTLNFARSLAEPNLTTLNGKPAQFFAGGSFPIPISVVTPGGAAQSVAYQEFGIRLQFTPYITDRTRIRLVLNSEVSTRSAGTTAVAGASVPSEVDKRNFTNTVELREGQTLTVAGLIQNNFGGTSNRVPWWGDLPIIGRTGGLDNITSGEQELVVLVTPVLVHPLDRCQTPPLPGNDIFEPGDVEFYLMGRLEGRRTEDFRASVRTDYCRQKAWCDCDDHYIIGPQGTTYGCCKLGCCPPPAAPPTAPPPGEIQPIPASTTEAVPPPVPPEGRDGK